jgi:alkylation response protein AidB-like acyl-CoA dehydrogenase
MTFDLTPEQAELQSRGRNLAATVVAPAAIGIDQSGEIPAAVVEAVAALGIPERDTTSALLIIEELAAASGAVAVAAALGLGGTPAGFAGLRGAPLATGDPDAPPHWALADAATEVQAARLLVHAAATGRGMPAEAVLVRAAAAAIHAADAALRIVGAAGYEAGSLLERCVRDARAAYLVLGTEDRIRQRAADALLA